MKVFVDDKANNANHESKKRIKIPLSTGKDKHEK